MNDKIVHTSDENFEADVLNSEKVVLIDFWAEWCGPCKMIAPLLDEAADQYADKLTIAKLNIDENPNTPAKYQIRSIPTLMLFKDQVELWASGGADGVPVCGFWFETATT